MSRISSRRTAQKTAPADAHGDLRSRQRRSDMELYKDVIVPLCLYFFRSTTHSQCESPATIFFVSLNVKFGFKLSTAPSPHL